MVSVFSLLLPILVAAVVVFVASSVIHLVLPYHKSDYAQLPEEEKIRTALKPLNIPPGDYVIPYASSMKEMQSEEFQQKSKEGPRSMLTIIPNGPPTMGKELVQWFLLCVVISLTAGYLAGAAYGPGSRYLDVFQFSGTVAFAAYGLGQVQASVWANRKWSTTIKNVIDGLIYALLTGGIFGWLWP